MQNKLKSELIENIELSVKYLNLVLSGKHLDEIEPILARIGRGGKLPHWFELLKIGSMPNLDGKTVGSVIEMTYVAVLERFIFSGSGIQFSVNPARGVDIPILDLGIKSPSENFCTSEPFFSAYERIIGSDHDALILLTDYQTAKGNPPPVKIQIIKSRFLTGSQIADKAICLIAKEVRSDFFKRQDLADAQRLLRFIAYVNQSDWLAKELLKAVSIVNGSDVDIKSQIEISIRKHEADCRSRTKEGKDIIPKDYLDSLMIIIESNTPKELLIKEADSWVINTLGDSARMISENEWKRFCNSELDGQIGMSFALQWRYNFQKIFK
jgi:hypothetical protein